MKTHTTLLACMLLSISASARDIVITPAISLARARDAAHSGDRIILRGGTYRLDEPLVLGPQNSGVTWMAAPGETPVIDGGIPVTGWTPDGDGRFKATVNLDNFRQLWVNGQRAQRTRGPAPAGLRFWGKVDATVKKDVPPPGMSATSDYVPGTLENIVPAGYTTTDANMADWKNPGDIEFGYYKSWIHQIAKIEKITRTADGAIIEMSQPGFFLSCPVLGAQAPAPSYIENALELLDKPGEWYFDRPSHTLYYMPRPGEQMDRAEVIAPKLETLLNIKGAHDVRFEGLTFAHATWLQPSTAFGHPDLQAGFTQPLDNSFFRPDNHNWFAVDGEGLRSPANIVVDASRGVQFDGCTFTALGGAGLDIENGSQSNIVSGCRFSDISGSGIQVGGISKGDHHPSNPDWIVKDNQIVNNVITRIGVEYTDAVGVFYGYTDGTVVAHNEIFDIPYSGVSGGWGWGITDVGGGAFRWPVIYQTPTVCRNNRIEYNHIYNLMLLRDDGGGVYTLGSQPGTIIRGNHIHNAGQTFRGNIFPDEGPLAHQVPPGFPGNIYLDEGSAHIEVTGNLVYQVPGGLHLNNRAQHCDATCSIHDNYFTPPVITVPGVRGRALKAGSIVEEAIPTDPAQFTVTAWIRLDQYPAGRDTRRWIVCKASNEWADHNISLIVDGKNVSGYLNIGGGQGNCFEANGTGEPLPLDKWTPVALTYDGDTLRVYFAGKEVGTKSIGKARSAGTAPVTIGGRSDRFSTFDCGDISDVSFYSRVLTPEELYTAQASGAAAPVAGGLVKHWNFEGVAGQDEAAKIAVAAGLEPQFKGLIETKK